MQGKEDSDRPTINGEEFSPEFISVMCCRKSKKMGLACMTKAPQDKGKRTLKDKAPVGWRPIPSPHVSEPIQEKGRAYVGWGQGQPGEVVCWPGAESSKEEGVEFSSYVAPPFQLLNFIPLLGEVERERGRI